MPTGDRVHPGDRIDHDGYRITRLRVPLDPDAADRRPRILGSALDRLNWPTLDRWREIAALLRGRAGDDATADDGGVPMIALDTETTGLSRSAGTLAFLIGLAWLEPAAIVVEQWTLTALAGEGALLRALGARLDGLGGPATTLVTFNGASFDLPLLRARFRRLRREPVRLAGPHLDLLLPARRLWREPAGDCRLTTLERTRLGVIRHDDVPGREIPGAFWAWIERPDDHAAASRIDQVHAHNQVDLLTLPALADALARALVTPSSLREALAVARWQASRGLTREALAALEGWIGASRVAHAVTDEPHPGATSEHCEARSRRHALGGLAERLVRLGVVDGGSARPREGERFPIDRGVSRPVREQVADAIVRRARDPASTRDPASALDRPLARESSSRREEPPQDPPHPDGGFGALERAALALAGRLWRRLGDPARAAACWARICRAHPGDPEAHEALAGLLEHRLGDVPAALHVAERSSDPCPRRLGRLGRKLSRRSPPGPHSVYG